MPLYSFVCIDCKHKFDELVPVEKRGDVICPKCAGAADRDFKGAFAFISGNKRSSCNGSNCSGCSGCGGNH